jgi:hypothetical protein
VKPMNGSSTQALTESIFQAIDACLPLQFTPRFSRALYTLPRPMFSAVATSVTERPALKSFTASSALSR